MMDAKKKKKKKRVRSTVVMMTVFLWGALLGEGGDVGREGERSACVTRHHTGVSCFRHVSVLLLRKRWKKMAKKRREKREIDCLSLAQDDTKLNASDSQVQKGKVEVRLCWLVANSGGKLLRDALSNDLATSSLL